MYAAKTSASGKLSKENKTFIPNPFTFDTKIIDIKN